VAVNLHLGLPSIECSMRSRRPTKRNCESFVEGVRGGPESLAAGNPALATPPPPADRQPLALPTTKAGTGARAAAAAPRHEPGSTRDQKPKKAASAATAAHGLSLWAWPRAAPAIGGAGRWSA
jgi:hypothetical protein